MAGFNNPIEEPDGTGRFYPPKYDRKNDVKIILNYDLNKKWTFTRAWVYATGQAYTEQLVRYAMYDEPYSGYLEMIYYRLKKVNAAVYLHTIEWIFPLQEQGTFFGVGNTNCKSK